MFRRPKKDFSAAASNLADQRAASYHAGEHAPILLASELPLWPSGDLHDSCRHCVRPPMMASSAKEPFNDPDWIFETSWTAIGRLQYHHWPVFNRPPTY